MQDMAMEDCIFAGEGENITKGFIQLIHLCRIQQALWRSHKTMDQFFKCREVKVVFLVAVSNGLVLAKKSPQLVNEVTHHPHDGTRVRLKHNCKVNVD